MILVRFTIAVLLFSGCQIQPSGEDIARRSCSSCHLFPEPNLLPKKIWQNGVLPEMKFRMSLSMGKLSTLPYEDIDEVMKAIPDKAIVTEKDWKAIEEYYLQKAPDSLPAVPQASYDSLSQFLPEKSLDVDDPYITLIRYSSASGRTYIGSRRSKLLIFETQFTPSDSLMLGSAPSHLEEITKDSIHVLTMGIMDPSDQYKGRLVGINLRTRKTKILLDSLKRPVHFTEADMDGDNDNDVVVSCFGNFRGWLVAFENLNGKFKQHVVHYLPGNRKAFIRDVNKDGRPDVITLITQGNEQIAAFYNRGDFKFDYKPLIRFPAVYGSSDFQLADFDKDGLEDILYCNGDNADYSYTSKPYHGVRIFLQKDGETFHESWFFPMQGMYQAAALDFDKDGDLDIAGISFFPDFHFPEASFIYLQNTNSKFRPSITSRAADARWLTMETGDIDNDQDPDIILGALNFQEGTPETLSQSRKQKNVSILVMKNMTANPAASGKKK
jgi:hypothetical protein